MLSVKEGNSEKRQKIHTFGLCDRKLKDLSFGLYDEKFKGFFTWRMIFMPFTLKALFAGLETTWERRLYKKILFSAYLKKDRLFEVEKQSAGVIYFGRMTRNWKVRSEICNQCHDNYFG